MGLLVKDKEIVIPGEVIAEGMDYLPTNGTFREGERIIASKLGIVNIDGRLVKLIPLRGKYLPKTGDTIIGKVIDITFSGWRIELNSAYTAILSIKDATSQYISKGADLTKILNIGDYIVAKIINVTSQNLVDLTMKGLGLRKLVEGRIIIVAPNKVPRIIGKQGSMISMIKEYTNCKIIVGQNGIVWVQGEPEGEIIAVKAIRMIEEQAHTSGLTDKVKEMLEENKGGKHGL